MLTKLKEFKITTSFICSAQMLHVLYFVCGRSFDSKLKASLSNYIYAGVRYLFLKHLFYIHFLKQFLESSYFTF